MRVEIWSDITCPWCYLGEARFEKALAAFPHRDSVQVAHRSYELNPGRAKNDIEPIQSVLMGHGMSQAQAEANERNLTRLTAAEGLGYIHNRDHGATFDMHRLLHHAEEQGRRHELLARLYHANFAEERSVFNDDERLVAIAVAAGLNADAARKVLADPHAHADSVRAEEQTAASLGISSVPFFVIDRKIGIAGAQSTEAFTRALEQAWAKREPLQMATTGGPGNQCGPDGCPVPHHLH